MFEHLNGHFGVIVTGPHRSGTTITGRMIAHDLGRDYTVEAKIRDGDGRFSKSGVFNWIKSQSIPWVLHGATCWRWISQIQNPEIAIVFVVRHPIDVVASQHRLGGVLDDPVAKQAEWHQIKTRLVNHYTVRHEDLSTHPLWEANREGWAPRQISEAEVVVD